MFGPKFSPFLKPRKTKKPQNCFERKRGQKRIEEEDDPFRTNKTKRDPKLNSDADLGITFKILRLHPWTLNFLRA